MIRKTSVKKFKDENERFPILFEDSCLRVYKNSANEIFIEDVVTRARIRVGSYHHMRGGLQFTSDMLVEPIQVNGMIGWRVGPR